MLSFVIFLLLITLVGSLIYHRVNLNTFAAAFLSALFLLALIDLTSWFWFVITAIVLLPFLLIPVRQALFSEKALALFRKIMPDMSETEKDAIEAGTVWWDGELFSGKPSWQNLHQISAGRLTDEEQAFLDGPCEEVCRMVDDWQITHELADLPESIWQFLKEHKFFAMIIKKEYGGLDFSAYAQSCVLQKLSGHSTTLATTVGVPNSLGPGELLQLYGTQEQQQHYLPRLASGEDIPCFALTSPEAGSDAGAIPDTGIVCKGTWQGEEVTGIRLNFSKRYITLAPVATVIGLAFKMYDPEGLLGQQEDIGITVALLPRDIEGLDIGKHHLPLNIPFNNGPVFGKDIFIPLDFIIGGVSNAGKGWRMLVECLSVGRGITLPSTSAGGVRTMALATGAYSRIRRQFKIPIGKMEGVQEAIGSLGANAYLMDAVVRFTTQGIDLGEKPSIISAISKYHLTEKLREGVNHAMDVHGGKGICLGPNNYLGRGYQGVPIAITVEGANILTRSLMIYGQGAIRCHPFVLEEMEAAQVQEPTQALSRFDKALFGHIGFALSNAVRTLFYSFGGYRLVKAPTNDETARYYQQMSRFSANLAFLSDIAMAVYGGDLKRKERISARLGDMLSYLFIGSAVLKRFQDEGRQAADLPLVHWAMQDTLYKLQESLLDLCANFKLAPCVLKALLFPFGTFVHRPKDELDHQITQLLMKPNDSRDRIAKGMSLSPDTHLGYMNQVLHWVIEAEPVHQKIMAALGKKIQFIHLDVLAKEALEKGIINQQEAEILQQAEQGRLKAIHVDHFDKEYIQAGLSGQLYTFK